MQPHHPPLNTGKRFWFCRFLELAKKFVQVWSRAVYSNELFGQPSISCVNRRPKITKSCSFNLWSCIMQHSQLEQMRPSGNAGVKASFKPCWRKGALSPPWSLFPGCASEDQQMKLATEQKGPSLSSLFQNPVGRSIFLAFHFFPLSPSFVVLAFQKKKKGRKEQKTWFSTDQEVQMRDSFRSNRISAVARKVIRPFF